MATVQTTPAPIVKAFSIVRIGKDTCEVLAINKGGVVVQVKSGRNKGCVFTARFKDVR